MSSNHVLVQLFVGDHTFCCSDPKASPVEERGCPKIFLLVLQSYSWSLWWEGKGSVLSSAKKKTLCSGGIMHQQWEKSVSL